MGHQTGLFRCFGCHADAMVYRRKGEAATAPVVGRDREAFGRELRRLREEGGFTCADLAEAMNQAGTVVSGAMISNWERGESSPKQDKLEALERCLNPPSTLAALAGVRPPAPYELAARVADLVRRVEALEVERKG